jgi:uncharacterized protein (TIGR02145 family)
MDTYGFAALPGGYGSPDGGSFYNILNNGSWWTASEESYGPRYRYIEASGMNLGSGIHYTGSAPYSVRCIQDDIPNSGSSSSLNSSSSLSSSSSTMLCVIGTNCIYIDQLTCLQNGTPVEVCPVSSSSSFRSSSSSSSSVCTDNSYGARLPITYEGQTYNTVKIGCQIWMAENLNYYVSGSDCYDNDPANCDTYGRMYDWATAMVLPASCNENSCTSQINAKHRGICPAGWHIPTNAEWDQLYRYVDGDNGTSSPYESPTAGRYLKATNGWRDGENGLDTYGFAALPGTDSGCAPLTTCGGWWTASERPGNNAYCRNIFYDDKAAWSYGYYGYVHMKGIRCVQD